ncbi:MAG: hypothetical protein ACP6KW_03975 [Candidatus Thorarchaeota archaeon]
MSYTPPAYQCALEALSDVYPEAITAEELVGRIGLIKLRDLHSVLILTRRVYGDVVEEIKEPTAFDAEGNPTEFIKKYRLKPEGRYELESRQRAVSRAQLQRSIESAEDYFKHIRSSDPFFFHPCRMAGIFMCLVVLALILALIFIPPW